MIIDIIKDKNPSSSLLIPEPALDQFKYVGLLILAPRNFDLVGYVSEALLKPGCVTGVREPMSSAIWTGLGKRIRWQFVIFFELVSNKPHTSRSTLTQHLRGRLALFWTLALRIFREPNQGACCD
jgi:hypothetical protein